METWGSLLVEQKRYREAGEAFRTALQYKPGLYATRVSLAQLAYHEKRYADAEREHGEALKTHPDYPEALAGRVQAMARLGRTEEALASFRTALKTGGRHAVLWQGYAEELYLQKQWGEAARAYERLLELRPTNWLVLSHLGMAEQNQGRAAQAVARYRQAHTLAPNEPDSAINLAMGLLNLGEAMEADRLCRKVLAAGENHKGAVYARQVASDGGAPRRRRRLLP